MEKKKLAQSTMKCILRQSIYVGMAGILSCLLMAMSVQAQTRVGGIVSGPNQEGNIISLSAQNANVRLTFCTPSMVRVRTSWDQDFNKKQPSWMVVQNEWEQVSVDISEHSKYYEFTTDRLVVRVYKQPLLIEFYNAKGKLLSTERLARAAGGMKKQKASVVAEKKLFAGEHFFGFGEKMTFLDQRGKKLRLKVGRGEGPTHVVGAYNILEANYSPIPFFMSTRGYGIFFRTPYTTVWDMGHSNRHHYSFKAMDGELDYYFIYGPEFPSIVDRYTTLTGKPPMVPKFALGLNVGTYSGGTWGYEEHTSTAYVVDMAQKFKQKGIPADILHLDSTWRIFSEGGHGATTYEWRKTMKHPTAMFDSLYAMGYNMVGLHIRPRYDNGEDYHLLDRAREADMAYPEADHSGVFVNFFDEEAVDWWWKNAAMKVASQGAMFFKTDEGDSFTRENIDGTKPHSQEKVQRLHNIFPIAYTKAVFKKFSDYNNMRGYILTREGYAGIQRYPYIWAGDWPSEWQYFEPVIRAGLNMGLSGVGYWSHNMGGFEHKPDPELYIRWCQFGLFSPIAHLFGMDHPGYKLPWSYGEKAERIFKKYTRMRYRLIPYIYSEAWKMHKTGVPLMQALVLQYQHDVNVYDIDKEYMFGSSLLIAPVTTKDAKSRVVYLPEGIWFDYWSGKKYNGGRNYLIVTPLDELPIFVKAGSIIPKRNRIESLGEQPPDTLTLEIFPYGTSSYEIYSDDGVSKNYLQGEYAITKITVKARNEQTQIEIQKPRGEFEVPLRSYKLQIHTDAAPQTVREGEAALREFEKHAVFKQQLEEAGWYFDEENDELHVRLGGNSASDITVTITK